MPPDRGLIEDLEYPMDTHIISEVKGRAGLLTLNRAKALNALSLAMIRDLTASLLAWRDDPAIAVVALRGMGKAAVAGDADQAFGAFCAGGDIRFFHRAALAGNPELEDFFTEEYRLNHLIHSYPKPVVAFMDGIVMGGGMGLAQGASARIVTARTKMAMPETQIGLFPDVGGGYFLSRCAGHLGEYLALTGHVIDGPQAVAARLADQVVQLDRLEHLWDALADYGSAEADTEFGDPGTDAPASGSGNLAATASATAAVPDPLDQARIDRHFGLPSIGAIVQALEADAAGDDWARSTAAALRKRSPLMLHVTLEQIRRARSMSLADDLRMERDLVRHCFHPAHLARTGAGTEVVEGIRALAVDKDHAPRWAPARIEEVTSGMVDPYFQSPWPTQAHPLRDLR
jgi:enoyl-CoA hydratase/carnithine racemase